MVARIDTQWRRPIAPIFIPLYIEPHQVDTPCCSDSDSEDEYLNEIESWIYEGETVEEYGYICEDLYHF